MGRSVSYLSNADAVYYFDVSNMGYANSFNEETGDWDGPVEYDEFQSREDWELMIDNLQSTLRHRYPSIREADRWEDREDHIIAENDLVEIAVAEYSGLASVSLRLKDDESIAGLAGGWLARTIDRVHRVIAEAVRYPELSRMGTFSNGTGVFNRVDKPEAIYENAGRIL